jgi:hypothetical protein
MFAKMKQSLQDLVAFWNNLAYFSLLQRHWAQILSASLILKKFQIFDETIFPKLFANNETVNTVESDI